MPVSLVEQARPLFMTAEDEKANGFTIDFRWVLEYELQAALRYRRYVTLVIVKVDDRHGALLNCLRPALRQSDGCFISHNMAAILMSETDSAGALKAVERFHHALQDHFLVHYAVASYPNDGFTADDLLETLRLRLLEAELGPSGTVIHASSTRQGNGRH